MKKDPRVDKYIKDANPFAKPILNHLRKVIRESCPTAEETIKWRSPFYVYQGKVLCGVVAFKAHMALLFWNRSLMVKAKGEAAKAELKDLRRITQLKDLPSVNALKSYIKLSMKIIDSGEKRVRLPPKKKPPVKTPTDLLLSLKANPRALKKFKEFSESVKRHYVEWILDAKTEETRDKRLEKAIDAISAGKKHHWD